MGRERERGNLDFVRRWKGYQQRTVEERAQCEDKTESCMGRLQGYDTYGDMPRQVLKN